jgi:hypothetical protein
MKENLPPLTMSVIPYCYELAEDYEFGPRSECKAERHEKQDTPTPPADYWVIFFWTPHASPMEIIHCQPSCEECAIAMGETK